MKSKTCYENHKHCNGNVCNHDKTALKGTAVEFQDECRGTITEETEDAIHIVSAFFTGWMYKAEYFDLLGIED